MEGFKLETLLPMACLLSVAQVHGSHGRGLIVKGTTVGPDFPKIRRETFSPTCPAMSVSFNHGKLCCRDPVRSDVCPGYQSDLIQRDDPQSCCRDPDPFPCPEGVCYSKAVTLTEVCPFEYPNPIAFGTRCTLMTTRSANCPMGAEGSPLVLSDPPECAADDMTVSCIKGSPKHWARCAEKKCEAPGIVSSDGHWPFSPEEVDFSAFNVLTETCERTLTDPLYASPSGKINVGFVMHMGCVQVAKEILIKNTKNRGKNESATKDFKIEVSLDGQTWTEIVRAKLNSVSHLPCENIQIEKFPASKLVKAQYLRFTLLSYYGGHGGLNYLSWIPL